MFISKRYTIRARDLHFGGAGFFHKGRKWREGRHIGVIPES